MAILWLLVGAALVVLVSVFHAQNPRTADLAFFDFRVVGAPFWLLVGVPAIAGLGLGFLVHLPARVGAGLASRRLARQLQARDQTIGQLQQRVAELERDLAVAGRPVPPMGLKEVPEVPDGGRARTDQRAA